MDTNEAEEGTTKHISKEQVRIAEELIETINREKIKWKQKARIK